MSEEQEQRDLRGHISRKKPKAKPGKDEFVLEEREPIFPLTPEERKASNAHLWVPARLREQAAKANLPPAEPPTEPPAT